MHGQAQYDSSSYEPAGGFASCCSGGMHNTCVALTHNPKIVHHRGEAAFSSLRVCRPLFLHFNSETKLKFIQTVPYIAGQLREGLLVRLPVPSGHISDHL